LGAIPDTSISGRRVARELTAIIERQGQASHDRQRQLGASGALRRSGFFVIENQLA
jgi:hypothetical protein